MYKTLGELRSTLQTRLGFGAAGAGAGVNAPIIDNFLYNAQVQLYWAGAWNTVKKHSDISLGAGQVLVDYPVDAEPERITKIACQYSGGWTELTRGIESNHWNSATSAGPPSRYDHYMGQMELWPETDTAYTLRLWYSKRLGPFVLDGDRATINDDLIFLHALANGKSHYRHPDAEFYTGQLNTLMTNLKSLNMGSRSFRRDRGIEGDPYQHAPSGTI